MSLLSFGWWPVWGRRTHVTALRFWILKKKSINPKSGEDTPFLRLLTANYFMSLRKKHWKKDNLISGILTGGWNKNSKG